MGQSLTKSAVTMQAPTSLGDSAVAVANDEFSFDAEEWAVGSNNEVFAQSVGESENGRQMREALRDVVLEKIGEQTDDREEALPDDSDVST